MVALPKARMSANEYLRWSATQDGGRFELVGGEVIAMSPETLRHVRLKNEIWLVLRNALASAGSSCSAFGDGVGIQIDDKTVREPDVSVQCAPFEQDSLLLDQPVVVVEVVSLSSVRSDTGAKVADYFRVPSICHYLIVDPYSSNVIHHARVSGSETIGTRILTAGPIELVPPGVTVQVEELLGVSPAAAAEESL